MQDCEARVLMQGPFQVTSFYKYGVFIGKRVVHPMGDEAWYNNDGQLHSFDDKPATMSRGHYGWYKNGLLHRDNAPASVWHNNEQIIGQRWIKNNKTHRKNGPAIVKFDNDYFYNNRLNEWWGYGIRIQYKDVPEFSRLPASLRAAMLVLPLPIGNEILNQCEWIWPFE